MSPLILLVDSDDDTRAILRSALESRGHEVMDAPDGETGLRLVDEHDPALIIGDFPLDVPGHSPFTRASRKGASEGVLILSFTSRVLPHEIEAAMDVADRVIKKPRDPMEVVAEIERMLAERGGEA